MEEKAQELDEKVVKSYFSNTGALWWEGVDGLHIQQIFGLDISSKMLKIASKKAKRVNVTDKIALQLGDIEHLPYKDAAFDIVCCLETFVHLANPFTAMNELARVCKHNGFVVADADYSYVVSNGKFLNLIKSIYYANFSYPLRLFAFKFFNKPLVKISSTQIYRTIPQRQFVKYFETAGLKVKKIMDYGRKRSFAFIVVYAKKTKNQRITESSSKLLRSNNF